MADEKNHVIQIGPGFGGTLTIVFIVLKLLGYINWGWLWVLCPLWIGLALSLAIWLIIIGVAAVMTLVTAIIAAVAQIFSRRK